MLPKATAAAVIPAGLGSERPGSPVAGLLRFNTETLVLEYYTGSGWSNVAAEGAGGFASGTKIVFAQATAPSGWVQISDATYNDAAIRLVTSAGGGTGGTVGFTTAFASQTVPLPEHTHVLTDPGHLHNLSAVGLGTNGVNGSGSSVTANPVSINTDSRFTGITMATAGTAGASINFAVKYVNMIVAIKS